MSSKEETLQGKSCSPWPYKQQLKAAAVTGTACAGLPSTTLCINKGVLEQECSVSEAAPPFCSHPGWRKGWDRASQSIHLLYCPVGSHRTARTAPMAVLWGLCPSKLCCSPVLCTPPLQLVTNGRELRDRIPPSFAFIKRSPRKCDFFSCEQISEANEIWTQSLLCEASFQSSFRIELPFPFTGYCRLPYVLWQARFNRKAEVMHPCLLPTLPALSVTWQQNDTEFMIILVDFSTFPGIDPQGTSMCIPHIHTKYLHSCSRIIKSFRLGKTSKVRLSLCVRLRQCWHQLPVVHVLPISRSKCALTHVHTTLCTPSSKHNLSFAHSQNKQIPGKIIIMYILSLTHAAIPTNLHALSPSTHRSWPPPLGMQEVWESITIYSPSIHHCQVCSPLFTVTDKQSKGAGHQYAEEGRWALCQHKKQEDTAESSWGCSYLLQPTEQSCHCPEISCFIPRTSIAEQNRAITTGHFPEIT